MTPLLLTLVGTRCQAIACQCSSNQNQSNIGIRYINHWWRLGQMWSNIESLGEFNFCIICSEAVVPSTHQIVTKCHAVRSNLRQRSKVWRRWGQVVRRCHWVTIHQPWACNCPGFLTTQALRYQTLQTKAQNTKLSSLNTDYKLLLSGNRNHCNQFESTRTH